ncbi:NAD(P)H-binding protein [Streptomyces sp. NPDC059680]|uniref:NAD(P)H-binding protein n=1 Tax=Streptomyces sp. NPDC059680 TaxID=3346904 RepID=UPI0036B2F8FA
MSDKNHATVAVTGVTGALGSRIAARLADHGVPQLLVGRSPHRMPELPGAQRRGPAAYADAADMRRALEGASTLILVSGHRTDRRLEEHATAVEAAIAAGVGRVLYVSLVSAAPTATYLNARDHTNSILLLRLDIPTLHAPDPGLVSCATFLRQTTAESRKLERYQLSGQSGPERN